MRYNRHIRPAFAALVLLAPGAHASQTVELSAADGALRIDVSDVAPDVIEVASDNAVPVRWTRGVASRATLPLIVLPGAGPTIAVSALGETRPIELGPTVARVRIDADVYAAPWPAADARRWPMLAATSGLILLLASRVRPARRGAVVVACVAVAITGGILFVAARRDDVERREQGGVTWLRARRATVARVSIAPGDAPIVESRSHLRALAPRVEVDREGRAVLAVTLARGARVAIERGSR